MSGRVGGPNYISKDNYCFQDIHPSIYLDYYCTYEYLNWVSCGQTTAASADVDDNDDVDDDDENNQRTATTTLLALLLLLQLLAGRL